MILYLVRQRLKKLFFQGVSLSVFSGLFADQDAAALPQRQKLVEYNAPRSCGGNHIHLVVEVKPSLSLE